MKRRQDWRDTLKADPTEWLLEKDNPVVRCWVLRDLVGGCQKEVETARQQALRSEVVQEGLSS